MRAMWGKCPGQGPMPDAMISVHEEKLQLNVPLLSGLGSQVIVMSTLLKDMSLSQPADAL